MWAVLFGDLLDSLPDYRRLQLTLVLEGELPVREVVYEQQGTYRRGDEHFHDNGPAGEVLGPWRDVEVRLPRRPQRPPARDGDSLPVLDVPAPAVLPLGLVGEVVAGSEDIRDLVVAVSDDRLLKSHQVGLQFPEALGEHAPALVPLPAPSPQVERRDAHQVSTGLVLHGEPPRPLASKRTSHSSIADLPGDKTPVPCVQTCGLLALQPLRGLVEIEVRSHDHLLCIAAEVEAELFGDVLHGAVVEEDLCGDASEVFCAAHFEDSAHEQGTDAPALEAVADQDREFGLVGGCAAAAQAGDAQDLAFSRIGVGVLGDQGQLAVIVYIADAGQALVGRALGEVHHVKVAHVDALFGERLVELHHQGLVFGPDRAYRHRGAVAQLFVGDVLCGIGAYRRARQVLLARVGIVQNYAGVEGRQAPGRGEERVDVELLDPGLFHDELAHAHEQLLQRANVDRGLAPDAAQRLEDACLLHHTPRERGGQRREGEGPVPVDLDQRAAGAEEQNGPKLRVQAAPDDQLVPLQADHLDRKST